MTEDHLVVTDIHKSLGALAVLKGISFTLKPGEIVSLLGHSGSGKTTLLRAVAGLETPELGSITMGGESLLDSNTGINLPPERRGLGLVFQSYALWPHRTVFDNIAYGLALRKTPQHQIKARVEEVLAKIGLAGLGTRYPHQISGGQQQRVALARAIVYRPPVLLLDEPLSNLDAKLREEARIWLRELIQQFNLSALYVTHDQVEAMAVSDRILFLRNGTIQQQGTPEDIYLQPTSAVSAEFMGVNNILSGEVIIKDGTAVLTGAGWRLAGQLRGASTDQTITAKGFFRVERSRLCSKEGSNSIEVDVLRSVFLGERYEYVLRLAGVSLRAWGVKRLDPGRYWIDMRPEDVWIFPD
ncbi:ABC transporter ATP-binding protein [Phyllobacterium sp. SB3]|uniref:ABC transporter ATP-binding protein n=1 Tax=Phyllobacterium sp. SB3 TaxID=3156073 RepID=UPI0032AEA558